MPSKEQLMLEFMNNNKDIEQGCCYKNRLRGISPPKEILKPAEISTEHKYLRVNFNGVQSKIAGCVYLMSLPSFSLATSLLHSSTNV